MFAANLYAKEYPAYWLCADQKLQSIPSQASFKGKTVDLFVNYNNLQDGSLHFSKVTLSKVDIPQSLEQGNYIMLGGKGEWPMNCVGQVVKDNTNKSSQLLFDVRRNAFGCPLVPQGCEANKLALLDHK